MWYQKLLGIIDKAFVSSDEKMLKAVSLLDPKRISLENVRSLFNISTFEAKAICKTAVKDGVFTKRIGVYCPNKNCERIIKSYNSENEIEEIVDCENCELSGEEMHEFKSNLLKREEFYQLVS
jgi:hypothetical protein